jgi:hypothetical protein
VHLRIGIMLISVLVQAPSAALATDFTGFWKPYCTDAFGIQIKPHKANTYSVSFCGPGGCFEPGTWMPNTTIEGDPAYRVIDANNIELKKVDRWQRFTKCTTDTNPVLDYSTMKDVPRESGVTYFQPNQGLPNYESASPFTGRDPQVIHGLMSRSATVQVSTKYCQNGTAKVPHFGDRALLSNICNKQEFEELRVLVSKLAPGLDKNRLSLWKTELHSPGNQGLLVGYIDISNDKNFKYPYLSLWYLDFTDRKYRVTYGGSFLAGQVQTIRGFGSVGPQKRVFVKYQSCIECHPWLYMTIIDFMHTGTAAPYQFTYATDHMEFGNSFEYELPGMGHSVDADVETRVPKSSSTMTAHLIQHFKYRSEDKQEWWVFTCKDKKCDYEMHLKELPNKYRQTWNTSDKL